MKIKKYTTLIATLVLIFMFLYTLQINFSLENKLNIINLAITFLVLILWLVGGYLMLIKDIFKGSEQEKRGISLAMVLLGIIFFYYNPFPKPADFFIDLPRVTYFILTIVIFIVLLFIFWKESTMSFIIALFIPFSIQSYLVNIAYNTNYTGYTFYAVIAFLVATYIIQTLIKKNDVK